MTEQTFDCAEFRDRVSAVHDGERVEDGSWRRHALLCGECSEFERRLPGVAEDLAVLRGTPVPDLWPALTARAGHTPRWYWIELGALAAGALATWGLLSWLAGEGSPGSGRGLGGEGASLVRALATISSESSSRVELARMDGTPELRLLAHLGAVKEDDR